MKRYLIFFVMIFTFFVGYKSIFAQENYDTNYNLQVDEYDFNSIILDTTNNISFQSFFDNLISLNSDYYNLFFYTSFYNSISSATNSSIYVYLYPKSLSSVDVSVYGYSSNLYFYSITSGLNVKYYSFTVNTSTGNDVYNSSNYNNFLNCYQNNLSCTSTSNAHNILLGRNGSSINNTLSYNLFVPPTNISGDYYWTNYPVYSSVPFKIVNDITGNSYFYKNLFVNEKQYEINDYFPTYYDLFLSNIGIDIYKELDNYNQLSNFYFRINKTDISNFSFSYEFNPLYSLFLSIDNANYFDDFYDDLDSGIMFFGRKYNSTNNYYTYDRIDCTLNHTYIKNSNTINSNGANLTCSTDLIDFDYIYIYLDQFLKSDENSNPTIKYVNLSVTSAFYHYGDFTGYIYDKFDNLSSDFEMSFSSNETGFSSVFSNINYGLIAEKVRVSNNEGYVPTALTTQPLEFSYDYNSYYVIFNDSSKYSGSRNIEFFTFPNTIISFSDNTNNNFYIYDENKQINNVTAKIQYYLNNSTYYDISYYFGQVNNYISGLSLQITNFANLTQNMYDNLPGFLQLFIFITFILFCVYFVYKLIKK